MENKNYTVSNISAGMGGSLIVVIFMVLCLTIFSVLSFNVAYSDLKLAEKTEVMTADYYMAHGKAEEELANIYNALSLASENMEDTDTPDIFYNNAVIHLTEIDGISIINTDIDSFQAYYEALGDKNQKICVTLNILYDEVNHRPYYTIETWNLSPIELPNYEQQNIDLWEGLE